MSVQSAASIISGTLVAQTQNSTAKAKETLTEQIEYAISVIDRLLQKKPDHLNPDTGAKFNKLKKLLTKVKEAKSIRELKQIQNEASSIYGIIRKNLIIFYAIDLGEKNADNNEPEEALKHYTEAIKLDPDGTYTSYTYLRRADIKTKLGNTKGAIADYKKACEKGTKHACASLAELESAAAKAEEVEEVEEVKQEGEIEMWEAKDEDALKPYPIVDTPSPKTVDFDGFSKALKKEIIAKLKLEGMKKKMTGRSKEEDKIKTQSKIMSLSNLIIFAQEHKELFENYFKPEYKEAVIEAFMDILNDESLSSMSEGKDAREYMQFFENFYPRIKGIIENKIKGFKEPKSGAATKPGAAKMLQPSKRCLIDQKEPCEAGKPTVSASPSPKLPKLAKVDLTTLRSVFEKKPPKTVVIITAEKCTHCQTAIKDREYEKFANANPQLEVIWRHMPANEYSPYSFKLGAKDINFLKEFGIGGFPSVFIFKGEKIKAMKIVENRLIEEKIHAFNRARKILGETHWKRLDSPEDYSQLAKSLKSKYEDVDENNIGSVIHFAREYKKDHPNP